MNQKLFNEEKLIPYPLLFLPQMIAFVEGKFEEMSPARVVVNVHGVGYELHISLHTYEEIAHLKEGKIYTHLQITENAQTLFGFSNMDEKATFLQLISISGVGASTARMMLSGLKPAEVRQAILQGNSKLLESVKGIGKKTAERIIVELKDKVSKLPPVSGQITGVPANKPEHEAVEALLALGIQRTLAESAVQKTLHQMSGAESVEVIIKQALKNM